MITHARDTTHHQKTNTTHRMPQPGGVVTTAGPGPDPTADPDLGAAVNNHTTPDDQPATDLTEHLERGRTQLLEAMSAVSEDRTCCGWASDWARTLHAEGGIWETLGRAVGWPTGNYDAWVWMSWEEAAELYGHAAVSAVRPPATDRTALREQIADTLTPFFANFSDEDTARINAGEAAAAVLPAVDRAAGCICGHTEAQHFEDVCITEITGCDCGDFIPPNAAREVIDRWRQAATRNDRAAVLSDAERAMLTYALDQAQERIWSEDGFTDEDQAAVDSLRALAAESAAVVPDQTDDEGDEDEALRAKVEEATATLRRIRALTKDWDSRVLPRSQAHRLLTEVCDALAGPRPDRPAVGGAQQPKEAEVLCRCGHGAAYHDAKYADPQCRLCPEDGERMWRHAFTPATDAPE